MTTPVAGAPNNKTAQGCLGCLGTIVLIGVVGGLASTCSGDSGGSGSNSTNAYGAESACEDWVKDKLKAPSTADFSNENVSGSNPWTVTGDVDAENSFGAKLRSSWVCNVRLEGGYYRGNAYLNE